MSRQIVAVGGGGFRASAHSRDVATPGPLVDFAVSLAETSRPRVCYLGTATGDAPDRIARFYGAFAGRDVAPSHLALFPQPSVPDVAAHLLAQDVVWVDGGSVANLLALWRLHGVDTALREAWGAGVVLAGVSAGSLCWFEGGTTDSFGPHLRAFTDGLGLIKVSHCPHYNSEERRRPTYHQLVGDGTLSPGWAADDGVALHFAEGGLLEAVADRDDAYAWRVARDEHSGEVSETRVAPRRLVTP